MIVNYIKMNDDGTVIRLPLHDLDGSITGRCIYGLKAWFDENPEERKRLGWVMELTPQKTDIQYDPQTQFLVKTQKMIDEYTLQYGYEVLNKTEEMMAYEEMTNGDIFGGGIQIWGFD